MRMVPSVVALAASLSSPCPAQGASRTTSEDPLAGSNLVIANGNVSLNGDLLTAAAHDPDSNTFLVAWEDQQIPSVTARVVHPDGSVGNLYWAPTAYSNAPSIAPVRAANGYRYAMVVTGAIFAGSYVWVVAIDPSNATNFVGAPVTGSSGNHATPDVGGGHGPLDDDVLVVYRDFDRGGLWVDEFDLDTMTRIGTRQVSATGTSPSIANTGGVAGRYLLAWHDGGDLFGTVIDRDLNVVVPEFGIATGPAGEFAVDVDGDGTNWVAAYQVSEAGAPVKSDVMCRTVSYSPADGSVQVGEQVVLDNHQGVDERRPAVTWNGDSVLVTWSNDFGGGDYDVHLHSLENFGCGPCEGARQVSTSNSADVGPAIASSGASGDLALLSWVEKTSTPATTVRFYDAEDGAFEDLGGACGAGGHGSGSCSAVGGTMALHLQEAAASAPGVLMLGVTEIAAPCGPCSLVTNPVVTVPIATSSAGTHTLPIPLTDPALVGGQFLAQWLVAAPGGCVSTVSFSNGMRVTIE